MIDEFFARHEKVALMYSGGKDSLACLHLLSDYLDRVTVVWVNTGASFPEIEDAMRALAGLVPSFLEVKSDQPAAIAKWGYPTDVLPVDSTVEGQLCTEDRDIKLRSYLDCCKQNIWLPLMEATKAYGFTGVIRGQRDEDSHRSSVRSGAVVDGIEYLHPIEGWSTVDVLEYLESRGVDTAGRLAIGHSSLDCWNCTAYCSEGAQRLAYIRQNHPDKHAHVVGLLMKINAAVSAQAGGLQKLLEEVNHGV